MKRTNIPVNTFFKIATGSKRFRILLTPVGAFFFLVLLGCWIALSLWLDHLAGFPKIFSPPLNIALCLPLLLAGIFLASWSVAHFLRARGTPVPFNPPPRVVTTGPYAYCRNPMVSGIFFILLGLGAFLQSVSLFLILTPVFILLNILELKRVEEPELEKRLGQKYLVYKRDTPMFIPRLKRKFRRG